MAQKLDYIIIDLLESTARNIKAQPVNLGGIAGAGGGVGGPPGGFIGWLPQTRVAYDETEAATLDTSISGSLLDNLNHIRYRLGVIESGGGGISGSGVIVVDDNELITYDPITTIHFSGAGVTVMDLGDDEVRVVISATGSGGGIEEAPINSLPYGRQDAAWVNLHTIFAGLDTVNNYSRQQSITSPAGENALSIHTEGNASTLDIIQETENTDITTAAVGIQRTSTGAGDITSPLIRVDNLEDDSGEITGDFVSFRHNLTEVFNIDVDGHAYDNGEILITEAPIDGQPYARQDGDWVVASGGSGSGGDVVGTPFYFTTLLSSLTEDANAMREILPAFYDGGGTSDLTVGSLPSGDTKLIYVFITPEFWPEVEHIAAGTIKGFIQAKQDSGTREMTVRLQVYKQNSAGTQTLIATTDSTPVLTGSFVEYELTATIATPVIMDLTDRLVVKVYYNGSVSGTDAAISFRVRGDNKERVEFPLPEPRLGKVNDFGWIPVADDWTRTGNHTFLVAGDQTAIYRKGAKIRYKDGGSYEYGVVDTSSVSTNTTVNLVSNTTYAMAAVTITDKYISYTENPEGWPDVSELKETIGELHTHDSLIYKFNATLNDDTATSFTPPANPSTLQVFAGNTTVYGFFRCNTASPAMLLYTGGTNIANATGALAGTTGTDGKFTVSAHTDGKIYLENRLGSAVAFTVVVL